MLNFEECFTLLTQIEACLNSHPLTPLPEASDPLEVVTPGHFLIGKPLAALPQESDSNHEMGPLRWWQLCQSLVRHIWSRWSREYLNHIDRFSKWHTGNEDYKIGDIMCLREEPIAPTKWPLARIINIHPDQDGKVQTVTVKTSKGEYLRPVVKMVPLIQQVE